MAETENTGDPAGLEPELEEEGDAQEPIPAKKK
jgi:hypothetical protein